MAWSLPATFGASFTISTLVLEVVLRWARTRLLDVPNERSSHTRPTPRGGGICVIAALYLVTPWALSAGVADATHSWFVTLFAGALLGIAAVSWADDRTSLPATRRLGVHIAMACVVVGAGIVAMSSLALPWRIACAPMLLFWLVGVTNAFNFMDGIDGIAGAQAAVAGALWAVVGVHSMAPVTGVIGLVLAAAAIAFLRRNWSPATIFMGDVGSASVGFVLATLPMLFAIEVQHTAARALAFPVAMLVLWPFLFDTTFTMLHRWRRGERLTQAHRSHVYQRLVIAGTPHSTVSGIYTMLALTGSGIAWWLTYDARAWLVAVAILPLEAWWLVRFAQARERRALPVQSD